MGAAGDAGVDGDCGVGLMVLHGVHVIQVRLGEVAGLVQSATLVARSWVDCFGCGCGSWVLPRRCVSV